MIERSPQKKHAMTACNGTVSPKTATEIDLVFSFLFLVLFVVPPSPSVQFLSCFWHLFNCVLFLSVFFRPLSSVPFFFGCFFSLFRTALKCFPALSAAVRSARSACFCLVRPPKDFARLFLAMAGIYGDCAFSFRTVLFNNN